MTEQAGDSLDVRTVIKYINCETVSGAVPGNVLIYPCHPDPVLDSLTATFIGGQLEDNCVLVLFFRRFTDQIKETIIKWYVNATLRRMFFGLRLVKSQ